MIQIYNPKLNKVVAIPIKNYLPPEILSDTIARLGLISELCEFVKKLDEKKRSKG